MLESRIRPAGRPQLFHRIDRFFNEHAQSRAVRFRPSLQNGFGVNGQRRDGLRTPPRRLAQQGSANWASNVVDGRLDRPPSPSGPVEPEFHDEAALLCFPGTPPTTRVAAGRRGRGRRGTVSHTSSAMAIHSSSAIGDLLRAAGAPYLTAKARAHSMRTIVVGRRSAGPCTAHRSDWQATGISTKASGPIRCKRLNSQTATSTGSDQHGPEPRSNWLNAGPSSFASLSSDFNVPTPRIAQERLQPTKPRSPGRRWARTVERLPTGMDGSGEGF